MQTVIANLPCDIKCTIEHVLNGDRIAMTVKVADILVEYYPEYGDFLRAVAGAVPSDDPTHPELWAAKEELKELVRSSKE